jgi:hypothetical protein
MGEWDSLMNQSVTIETFHSIDQYGDPSYNAAITSRALVQKKIRKVITLQGQEAVSSTLVILPSSVTLDAFGRDRITMPDGKKPIILAIEDAIDNDTGINDHNEVST